MVLFPAHHQKKILNRNTNKLQKQEFRNKTNGVFSNQAMKTKSNCPGIGHLNPYRQIPETISKKRAMTLGISRKLFPDFAILGRDSGDFPETFS